MTKINVPTTRGKLLFGESLSRYNTWGVGGNAECVFHPADVADLGEFLKSIDHNIPVTWLGLGSNVLIRDGGINGVVIITQAGLSDIKFIDNTVYAQAGVACAKLARASVLHGFTGIEFLAGIPGTVGGALAMNAGAFGGQTWEKIIKVDIMTRQGEIITRAAGEFEYSYRYVKTLDNEYFIAARFELMSKTTDTNIISIKELLAKRSATQPIGKKNCGSVFKNPKQSFAAELIEECGLKGFSIGGACVSEKHANFIINEQNATADDIEKIIVHVQKTVQEQCHIELVPEVRILGVST